MLKMKYRIMEIELTFLHYIIAQDEESLAHQIVMEQKSENFPGLVQECSQFINELKILEWKRIVKKAILTANTNELKEEIKEKYKKLRNSELVNKDFGRKDYINNLDLLQARTMFKYCSSMTQHVKMNQKSNKSYADALWRCEECGLQDTNSHLLWCAGYEALRDGKDLENYEQICDYLHKVFMASNEKLLV